MSVSAKTVSLDMSEDTNSTGDYSFWSPDHSNRAGMFRNVLESENQQEIPTNCSPAALGNVSNGYDVSIQEHQPKLVLSEEGNGISLFVALKLHTMESASTFRQRAEFLSWVIN